MRLSAYALAVLIALMLIAGPCLAEESIKVGIILPLTGPGSESGNTELASFEMALMKINEAGGIGGRKVEVVFADSMDSPEDARTAAFRLMDEHKVALICAGGESRPVRAAASAALNRGFPFLILSTPEDSLTEPASYTPDGVRALELIRSLESSTEPGEREKAEKEIGILGKRAASEGKDLVRRFSIFRLGPPMSEYPAGVLSLLRGAIGPKTAAVVYEDTETGALQARHFEEAARKAGIRTLSSMNLAPAAEDARTVIAATAEKNPDLLYMISYEEDPSQLVTIAREVVAEGTVLAGEGTGFAGPAFPEALEGVLVPVIWHESSTAPGSKEFYNEFVELQDTPPGHKDAIAFAAGLVVAEALKRADSLMPGEIKKALASLRVQTITGPVEFGSYNRKVNQNTVGAAAGQWTEGSFWIVWPDTAAGKEPVLPEAPLSRGR